MPERLTAIVTGAASGIGKETAIKFGNDPKYNPVYAADNDPHIHTVFEAHPRVVPLEVDVSKQDEARNMLQRAIDESGRLDVVVNAAGVMIKGKRSTFFDKTGNRTSELQKMVGVNLVAPFFIMTTASGFMKNGGTIINVSSAKYLFPDIHHGTYQEGKQALSKVTKRVAKAFREQDNVRVIDVQPGNTKTNIDRGVWTSETSTAEVESSERITTWWRNTFGSDPKKVAQVIYDVAEGKIDKTTVRVGTDTKIGRTLYLLTYPLLPYRFDMLFFLGSSAVYQSARLIQKLKDRFDK